MRSSPYYGVTRYLLLLCASIITLGAFQSASAQLLTFSIGSRSYDTTTGVYSADIRLAVAGANWQIENVNTQRIGIRLNSAAGATPHGVTVTPGGPLDVANLGNFTFTQGAAGTGFDRYQLNFIRTSAGITSIGFPLTATTIATVRWNVPAANVGLLDNMVFPTTNNDEDMMLFTNQLNASTTPMFNGNGPNEFQVTDPTSQVFFAPVITTQPAALQVCERSSTTFTVSASLAASLTYQWQVSTDNGSNFNPIVGATSASYTTTASLTDNGNLYRVVIVASNNPATTVTSNNAALTVFPLPTIASITAAPSVTTSVVGANTNATFTLVGTTGTVDITGFIRSDDANLRLANALGTDISVGSGSPLTQNGVGSFDLGFNYTGFSTTAQVTVTLATITSSASLNCALDVSGLGISTTATILPLGPALSATSAEVCSGQVRTLELTLGQQGGGIRNVVITTTGGVVVTGATAGNPAVTAGQGTTEATVAQATSSSNTITLYINGTVLSTGAHVIPVTITDAAGRSTTADLTVNVIALPAGTITVTGATATLPNGSVYVTTGTQVTLNVTTTGTANADQFRFTVFGTPTTGVSQTGLPAGFVSTTQQSVTVNYNGIATNATITFQIEGTTASGCAQVIGTTTITVVPPAPSVTFAVASVMDCNTFAITVTAASTVDSRLGVNTTGTVLTPFENSTGAGATLPITGTSFGPNAYNVTFATVDNTTRVYELTVTDAIGRVTTASLNITVYPVPTVASISINGTPTTMATVTSAIVATGPGNLSLAVTGANTANLEYRWRVTSSTTNTAIVPTTANGNFINLHTGNANFATGNSSIPVLYAVNVGTTSHTLTYTLDARNATTGCVVLGVTTVTVRVLPPAPVVNLATAPATVCNADGITQMVTVRGGAAIGGILAYDFNVVPAQTVSTGTFAIQEGSVNIAGGAITVGEATVQVTVSPAVSTTISGIQTFQFLTIDGEGRSDNINDTKVISVLVSPTITDASVQSTFGNTTSASTSSFPSGHPLTLGVTGANHVPGVNYTWTQVTATGAGVVVLTSSPVTLASTTQLTITPLNFTNDVTTVVVSVVAANGDCSQTTTFTLNIAPAVPAVRVVDVRSDNSSTTAACNSKPIFVTVEITGGIRPMNLQFSTNASTNFVNLPYTGLSFVTNATMPANVGATFSTDNDGGLTFGQNITISDLGTTTAVIRILGTAGFVPTGNDLPFVIGVTEATVGNTRFGTVATVLSLDIPLVTSNTRFQTSTNAGVTFETAPTQPAFVQITSGDVLRYRVTEANTNAVTHFIEARSGFNGAAGISTPGFGGVPNDFVNVNAQNPIAATFDIFPSTRSGIGTGAADINYAAIVRNIGFCEEIVTTFTVRVLPRAPQILALTPSNVTTCSGSPTETVFITVTNGSFTTTTALLNAITVTAPGAVATYTNEGTQFFAPGLFGNDNTTAIIQIALNTVTTGTYTFTLTDQYGRSTSSTIQININDLPTITSLTVNGVSGTNNFTVTNGNAVPVQYAASTSNMVQATWNVVSVINASVVTATPNPNPWTQVFAGNTGVTADINVVNNSITMATVHATLATLLDQGTNCVTANATTFTLTVLPTEPGLISQTTTVASTCATPTSSTTASFVFFAGAYFDLDNTARTDAQLVSVTGPGTAGISTSAVTINGNNAQFSLTFSEVAATGTYTVTITDWAGRTTSANVEYLRHPLPVITGANIAVNAPNTVVIVPANATTLTVRVTSGTLVTFEVTGANLAGANNFWTTTADANLGVAGFPGTPTTTNPLGLTFTNNTNQILTSRFVLNNVVTPFGCVTTANPALDVTFEVYPPAPQVALAVNQFSYTGAGPTWETVGPVTNATCENEFLRFNYTVTGGLGATVDFNFNPTTNLTPLTRDATDPTNVNDIYASGTLSEPRVYGFTGAVPTLPTNVSRNLVYRFDVGAASGNYTLTVTEGAPLFRSTSASVNITVNPLPSVNQAFVRAGGETNYTPSAQITVTSGTAQASNVSIYATGANVTGYGFQWVLVSTNNSTTSFAGNSTFAGVAVNQFFTANFANNTQSLGSAVYRLNLINFLTGCVSPNATTVTVTVHPAIPTLTLSQPNATICHPSNGGTAFTFQVTVTGGLVNGNDDVLSFNPVPVGSVSQTITRSANPSVWNVTVLANETATYNLLFQDSLGRQATAAFTLNVLPSLGTAAPLTINGTATTTTEVTTGTAIALASNPVQAGFEYRWIQTSVGPNITGAAASTNFIGAGSGNTLNFTPSNNGNAIETVVYELQVQNALCPNPVTVSTATITVYPAVPTVAVVPNTVTVLHPNQGGGASNFVATATGGVWAGSNFAVTPATGITSNVATNVNNITVAPNAHALNVASTANYTVTFTDGIGRQATANFSVVTQPDVTSASTFTINGQAITRALFGSGSLINLRALPRIPNLEYRWVRWSQTVAAPQFVATDSQAGWDTIQNEFPINVANNTNEVQTAVYRLFVRQNGNVNDSSMVFEATIDVMPAAPVVTVAPVQDTVCHPNQGGGAVQFTATVANGLRPGTWVVTPAVGTITTATLNANQVSVSITGIAADQTYTVTFNETPTALATAGNVRSASANFNVVVRPDVSASGAISVNGSVSNALTVTTGTTAASGIVLSFPQQPSFEYQWVKVAETGGAVGAAVPGGFAPANNEVSVNVSNSGNAVGTVQYRLEVRSTDCPAISTIGTVTITVLPTAPSVAGTAAPAVVCHPNNGGQGSTITVTATGGVWAGATFAINPAAVSETINGNVATFVVNPNATTTYTVTFTEGAGAGNRTATTNVEVTVLPELVAGAITVNGVATQAITVTSGTAAASGIALAVPANSNFTYRWSVNSEANGAASATTLPATFEVNGNSRNVNVVNNGNVVGTVVYRLEAQSANCGSFIVGDVTVTVNPAVPTLALNKTADTVCAPANGGNGTIVVATATGGVWTGANFAVTPNTGVTVQATAQPNVVNVVFDATAVSGNYDITFTDGLGRTATQTFALTVLPVLNAGNITVNGVQTNAIAVTSGTTAANAIELAVPANAAYSYKWSVLSQNSATAVNQPAGVFAANGNVFNANVANNGNSVGTIVYQLEAEGASCPSAFIVGTVTVTVYPVAPTLTLDPTADTVCHPSNGGNGTTVVATAQGGVWDGAAFTVTLGGAPAAGVTVEATAQDNVVNVVFSTTAVAGTYTVRFTEGAPLNRFAEQTFTLTILPEISGSVAIAPAAGNVVNGNNVAVTSGTTAAENIQVSVVPSVAGFEYRWIRVSPLPFGVTDNTPAGVSSYGTGNASANFGLANASRTTATITYRLDIQNAGAGCSQEDAARFSVTLFPQAPTLVLSSVADTVCAPTLGGGIATFTVSLNTGIKGGALTAAPAGVATVISTSDSTWTVAIQSASNENVTLSYTEPNAPARTVTAEYVYVVVPGVANTSVANHNVTTGTAAAQNIALTAEQATGFEYRWVVDANPSSVGLTFSPANANDWSPANFNASVAVANNSNAVANVVIRLETRRVVAPLCLNTNNGNVNITVNPAVPMIATSPMTDTICDGAVTSTDVVITGGAYVQSNRANLMSVTPATAGITFVNSPLGGNTVLVDIDGTVDAGTYTFTFTDDLGRTATSTYTLTRIIAPVVAAGQDFIRVTTGSINNVTLAAEAQPNTQYRWTQLGGVPTYLTYNFGTQNIAAYSGVNQTATGTFVNNTTFVDTVRFALGVRNTLFNCETDPSATVTVVILPVEPALVLTPAAAASCNIVNGGTGVQFGITVNGGAYNNGITAGQFVIANGAYNVVPTIQGANTAAVSLPIDAPVGTYTVTYTDLEGRQATATFEYTILPALDEPTLATANNNVCIEAGVGTALINNGTAVNATSNFTWTATPNTGVSFNAASGASATAQFTVPGIYTITLTEVTDFGCVTSSNIVLDVRQAPVLGAVNPPLAVREFGQTQTFSVELTAPAANYNVTWESRKLGAAAWTVVDNSVVTNGGTLSLDVVANFDTDSTEYRAIVENTLCGATVVSNTGELYLDRSAAPVIFINIVEGQRVCVGSTIALEVSATSGTVAGPGITFEWFRNGQLVATTTAPEYIVNNAAVADAGQYRVEAINVLGTRSTSNTVGIVVDALPAFGTPELTISQDVCVGQPATIFANVANNSGPIARFVLRRGGQVVAEQANNPLFLIENVSLTDAGTYTVELVPAGACANRPAITANGALSVVDTVAITAQPIDAVVCEGQVATFTVSSTGAASFQWQRSFDGNVWTNVPGANGATLTLNNVQFADEAHYRAVVFAGNNCGSKTTVPARLEVGASPGNIAITSQPASQTVCLGETAVFTVATAGVNPIAVANGVVQYRWIKTQNGVETVVGVGTSLVIPNVDSSDIATYRVEVIADNVCGTADVVSNSVGLIVRPPLRITVQPQPVEVCENQGTIELSVQVVGETLPNGLYDYQWYFNDQVILRDTTIGNLRILGSRAQVLTIENPGTFLSGNFKVVVRGGCAADAVTSISVPVVVNTATRISFVGNTRVTARRNQVVSFRTDANAKNPVYQWFRNNGNGTIDTLRDDGIIQGSRTGVLTINGVQESDTTADNGGYFVVVTGECGVDTARYATLKIPSGTIDVDDIADAVACEGSDATFTVSATTTVSNGMLRYQWYRVSAAGTPEVINGATDVNLLVSNVGTAPNTDGTKFFVIVTELLSGGTFTTNEATLVVIDEPQIAVQPEDLVACEDEVVGFSVAATAQSGTVRYQWFKDGVAIANQTAQALAFANGVTKADEGTYSVVITNDCGQVTSDEVTLTVRNATVITQQPQDIQLDRGVPFSFTVAATGEGTLTYQWFRNGNPIPGATDATYGKSTSAADGSDAGEYFVVVTGECGPDTSNIATATDTGVSAGEEVHTGFALEQNFPNPFTGATTIRYSVPTATHVRLVLRDVSGRELMTLVDQTVNAGSHTVTLDANKANNGTVLSSGMYLYSLTADGKTITKQLVLRK